MDYGYAGSVVFETMIADHGQGGGGMRARGNRRGRGQVRGGSHNRGMGVSKRGRGGNQVGYQDRYQGQGDYYELGGFQGEYQEHGGYQGEYQEQDGYQGQGGYHSNRGRGVQMRGGRGNRRGNQGSGGQTSGGNQRTQNLGRDGSQRGGRGGYQNNATSFKDGLQNFMEVVKNNTTETNDIMLISNTLYGGNYGFKDKFECEPLETKSEPGMPSFTGALYFGDWFIARHIDVNKKRIKARCYSKAVGIISTHTVDQILRLKDSGSDEPAVKEETKPTSVTNPVVESTVQLFDKLKSTLTSQLGLELNAISRLEQSGVIIKSPLFYVEGSTKDTEDKKLIFEGSLYFDEVHVGIARNSNKKLTKMSCYEMAFDRIMKLDSWRLAQGLSDEELSGIVTGNIGILTKFCGENLDIDLLRVFMEELAKPENKPFTAHFDIIAVEELKTSPSLLFRKPPGNRSNQITCELYLCNVLISNGQGDTQLKAKRSAYEYAELVFNMATPESILKENRRLTPEDKKAPDVLDYSVVSVNTRTQSNILKLKTTTWMWFPDECKNISIQDMIIMEQGKWRTDRKTQAFGILSLSCNNNGLLIEWDFERLSNNVFECVILIQGENPATVRTAAASKVTAKSLAAAHILFNLYETCPVIEVQTVDSDPRVITLEEVQSEGQRLKASGVLVEDLPDKVNEREKDESDSDATQTQTAKLKPDKYEVFAFKSIINNFFFSGSLGDIKLEANFPNNILTYARMLIDKFVHFKTANDITIIHKTCHPQKILESLRNRGSASGRFKLLPQNQVPTQDDLMIEMASSQRVLNAALKQKKELLLKKSSSNQTSPQKRKMAPPQANHGPSAQKKQRGTQHNYGSKVPGRFQQNRGGIQRGGFQKQQQNFPNKQQHIKHQTFQNNPQYFQNQSTTFPPRSILKNRGTPSPRRTVVQKSRGLPQSNRGGGIRPPSFLNQKKFSQYPGEVYDSEIYGEETYGSQINFMEQANNNYTDFTSDSPTLTLKPVTRGNSRGNSRGRGSVGRAQPTIIQNNNYGYGDATYYDNSSAFDVDYDRYYKDSLAQENLGVGVFQSFDYGHQSMSGYEESMMY